MTIESHIFESLGGSIDVTLNTFVQVTCSSVITGFSTTVVLAGTLYFVLIGYMMIVGVIEQPASYFFRTCCKFVFISALALNTDTYMTWVVDAMRGLETGITAAFSGQDANSSSVFVVLDQSVTNGIAVGGRFLEKMGNREAWQIGMMLWDAFNGLTIMLATLLISVPAGAMVIASKAMLSIMLGIGPIFILMLLFGKFTSQWFDRWFGQVMTYILQIALISVVLSFGVALFSSLITTMLPDSSVDNIVVTLGIFINTLVVLYLLQQANAAAAQLAGGIASAGISLRGVYQGAGNVAAQSGHLARGVAQGPLGQGAKKLYDAAKARMEGGNSIQGKSAGPAYRQHARNAVSQNRKS